jgi:hypothetical protein
MLIPTSWCFWRSRYHRLAGLALPLCRSPDAKVLVRLSLGLAFGVRARGRRNGVERVCRATTIVRSYRIGRSRRTRAEPSRFWQLGRGGVIVVTVLRGVAVRHWAAGCLAGCSGWEACRSRERPRLHPVAHGSSARAFLLGNRAAGGRLPLAGSRALRSTIAVSLALWFLSTSRSHSRAASANALLNAVGGPLAVPLRPHGAYQRRPT